MNKNIFIKMILIFLVPVIGMLFYSTLYISKEYKLLNKLSSIDRGITYVKKAEYLLNNIQKERGISTAYLSSKGIFFKNEFINQKIKSNKAINEYISFISKNNFKLKAVENSIKDIQEKLYFLNAMREDAINLKIKIEVHINKYNKLTLSIINSMSEILLKEEKLNFNKQLYSIISIISAKEYAGLERALLTNSFSSEKIITLNIYNNVIKSILLQNQNINKFKDSVDIDTLNYLNKNLNNIISNKVNKYRKDFFISFTEKLTISSLEDWWLVSTNRINAMGKTVDYYMSKVLQKASKKRNEIYLSFIYTLAYFFVGISSVLLSIIMLKKLTSKEQENFSNLNKLKQIYNILSNTNELIIYDYKMQDVLKQACVLATKELDLSLTFVALLNKNDELEIIQSSCKNAINIMDFNANKKSSAYQKVFFEKQAIVLDNIKDDKSSLDLTLEIKNYFKSLAIYPLFKDDILVGLISFCSNKINYFDKDIISILEKMANDLSYGLLKEKKELVRLKYEEELRIAAYAFDSQEAMAITDLDAKIVKINNAFSTITGYSQEEVLGQNPNILQSGRHSLSFYENMWDILIKDGFWSGELYNKRKNGEIYPEKTTITAIKNKEGLTTHYIAQFFDITELKKNEEKLIYEIQHDNLTGLYNRIVLEDRLNQSITSANRYNHFGALLFLDLDNFKYINDSLGHHIGDKLLKKIASILLEISRESDLVVRLGGDEFIIMVPNLGSNRQQAVVDVEKFAFKINEALNEALVIDTYKLTTTPSIGISLFPEFEKNVEQIIQNADSAMYMAKEKGKNKIIFYYDALDLNSKNYLKVENDLRKALVNNEFELYYQAKYNYETKKIIGYEALIRWNHPIKGLIKANDFIYIAEQSSLIIDIGKWVLQECCEQISKWLEEGVDLDNIKISINISSLEFEQIDFISKLKDILTQMKIPSKYLELEITELSMFKNIDLAMKKLYELRELGLSCSIDDFGIGFSSLNYISKLPINTIKLDKSFIINKDLEVNESIIEMIVSISRKLDINLIVEGVESLEDIEYLVKKDSYFYQGHFISSAVKAKEAIRLLEERIII